MGGMGYTTTLAVIVHTLHAHVDRCMEIEDVACQIMKNNLQRAMQEWHIKGGNDPRGGSEILG